MSTQRSSATNPGATLVAALAERDFGRLAGVLAPDARMRALIPPGPIELSGAEAVAARFASWFGDTEGLELVRSGSDEVSDRLHVCYRLRVKRPGELWKIIEQHLFCALDDGRITALDLVCSGFRPDAAVDVAVLTGVNHGRASPVHHRGDIRRPCTAQRAARDSHG